MPSSSKSVTPMRFLIAERDSVSFQELEKSLSDMFGARCLVEHADNGRQAARALRQADFDVVFADIESLGDLCTPRDEAIGKICRLAGSALVIALSCDSSVTSTVDAMGAGAHEVMSKPLDIEEFSAHISELGQRHGHIRAFNAQPRTANPHRFEGFVGTSDQMKLIYQQIERIAPSPAPVFITGESGTGKEVCAQALHQRSERADKPFIAINCSAIPRDLMEGEIFGVVRGAYTGADRDRAGAAEMAEGGVLFLDEIGELDLGLQAKLLRFLQTGTISRVGEATTRPLNIRVICATNKNPMRLIEEKKFREDLFYRLHVLPIHLPPLRQRPADILPLAQTFLARYAQEENKAFTGFLPETANLIMSRDWPGNVRQLQNLIRRVVVMFEGPQVSAQMINDADIEGLHLRENTAATPEPVNQRVPGEIEPMWRQEQRIIETAMARYNGNIALAAAALEISPSTIYRKRQAWEQSEGKPCMVRTADAKTAMAQAV